MVKKADEAIMAWAREQLDRSQEEPEPLLGEAALAMEMKELRKQGKIVEPDIRMAPGDTLSVKNKVNIKFTRPSPPVDGGY